MTILQAVDFPLTPEFNTALHSNNQVVLIRSGSQIPITGMQSNGTTRTVMDVSGSYYVMQTGDQLAVLDTLSAVVAAAQAAESGSLVL